MAAAAARPHAGKPNRVESICKRPARLTGRPDVTAAHEAARKRWRIRQKGCVDDRAVVGG
jgi:hypothetical protein